MEIPKTIRQGTWIPNYKLFHQIYYVVKKYFERVLDLPKNKIFYIGYQEFMQKYMVDKQQVDTFLGKYSLPFQTLNMTIHNIDRSKMNTLQSIRGIPTYESKKYSLDVQYVYWKSELNLNLFLETRNQLLEYLTLFFGLFDIPSTNLETKISFDRFVPEDVDIKHGWDIPIELFISMTGNTDESEYNYNTDMRQIKQTFSFTIEGYIPTKFKWNPQLEKIEFVTLVDYQEDQEEEIFLNGN